MQEVSFRIRFTTPCLGSVRPPSDADPLVANTMMKDADQRVIFMNSWWRAAFIKASRSISIAQRDVAKIEFDPIIDGPLSIYERIWANTKAPKPIDRHGVTRHEAFSANAVVVCRALVPNGLSKTIFRRLLETVGSFIGISPYGHQHGFGRFVIEDIKYGSRAGPDNPNAG